MSTLMQIICGWCKRPMGTKPGEGITHGICKECKRKQLEEIYG